MVCVATKGVNGPSHELDVGTLSNYALSSTLEPCGMVCVATKGVNGPSHKLDVGTLSNYALSSTVVELSRNTAVNHVLSNYVPSADEDYDEQTMAMDSAKTTMSSDINDV